MAEFTLKQAAEADYPAIKRLIHLVGINPMALDWRRFLIAVDSSGKLLGCGQLKPHGKELVELASIAVEPDYRNRGIAGAIIDQLLRGAPRPLYLICRTQMGAFYERWGFRALELHAMPPYFRRLARLARLFTPLVGEEGGMLVMELK